MESKIKLLISQLGENRVKKNIDLSEYLETGLGGLVNVFYIATTSRELIKAVQLCRQLKIPFFIFGLGSKIAFSKEGVKGLVIKNRSSNLKIFGVKGKVGKEGLGVEEALLEADSGVSLAKLASFSHDQGLGGLESIKEMLGTIGGTLKIAPILKEKTIQVKILTVSGSQKSKSVNQLTKEDIILSIVLKLKARKVSQE